METSTQIEGIAQTSNGGWKITANHIILRVTPGQIQWWWDHMGGPEKEGSAIWYKKWHPEDHKEFRWKVAPSDTPSGHIGAIQRITELLGGIPATFEIRWDDATGQEAEYSHVLLATVFGQDALEGVQAHLMHEYEALVSENPSVTGTRMRSHFWLPPELPETVVHAIYEHNKQEMQYFSTFLPALFAEQHP